MTRVAVVEDDAPTRDLIRGILGQRGYQVRAFEGVGPAWAELGQAAPDLLIADVNLPDGSGLELVARLRALHREQFPIIILSGLSSEQDFLRGFAAGACDYLRKPFTGDELLARCSVHLGRSAEEGTASIRSDIPLHDGLAFRRYELRGVLGRGAAGVVYDALDTTTGEAVALKVMAAIPATQPEARVRFLRETYALSSVSHPHVVAVRDFGTSEGRLYYAMERVAGATLRDRVLAAGPLGPAEARALLRGLAAALTALADVGLVHRDLTPTNVVLRGDRPADPVLVDFGLAKRTFDHGLTVDDVVLGTPGFVAPEVVLGQPHDARSDLFALGAVVRHALGGGEAWPGMRGLALLHHMTKHPLPVPEGLPADLRVLLGALLELDPARRPASARDVVADLGE